MTFKGSCVCKKINVKYQHIFLKILPPNGMMAFPPVVGALFQTNTEVCGDKTEEVLCSWSCCAFSRLLRVHITNKSAGFLETCSRERTSAEFTRDRSRTHLRHTSAG